MAQYGRRFDGVELGWPSTRQSAAGDICRLPRRRYADTCGFACAVDDLRSRDKCDIIMHGHPEKLGILLPNGVWHSRVWGWTDPQSTIIVRHFLCIRPCFPGLEPWCFALIKYW